MTEQIRRLWGRSGETGTRYLDVRRHERHVQAAARWRLLATVDAWMQGRYPSRGPHVEDEP